MITLFQSRHCFAITFPVPFLFAPLHIQLFFLSCSNRVALFQSLFCLRHYTFSCSSFSHVPIEWHFSSPFFVCATIRSVILFFHAPMAREQNFIHYVNSLSKYMYGTVLVSHPHPSRTNTELLQSYNTAQYKMK